MIIQNKEYMIKNMKNEDGSVNIKNVVLTAACEAVEFLKCMFSNNNLTDLYRFVECLNKYLKNGDYEIINHICQTMYGMHNFSDNLNKIEGLSLVLSDMELCYLYYQIFIGLLDLILFLEETTTVLNVDK